jgi:hypothetical protein
MQRNGDLVVRGPHGRARWSSHTAGLGPYAYLDAVSLELHTIFRARPRWHAKLPYPMPC